MESQLVSRRSFVHSALALPAGLALGARPGEHRERTWTAPQQDVAALERIVKLWGDGQSLTPPEYAHVLSGLIPKPGIAADYYSIGGVVAELETTMARILGKERAVFLPTGTLANHLAVRIQARAGTRVLVQDDSHLYADSGDCAEVLSNLNLVPMPSSTGTFTLEEVQRAVRLADGGRVRTGVGVISIESPIRRRLGVLFDYDEMRRICAWAREQGIATHLDGARLFMASGYTGITPAAYAAHFDTVYVSLWKYFNAAAGAILAGPRALLDPLYHQRRMFGGALPGAWPLAAVALHYVEGFEDRFAEGVARGEQLKAALERIPGLHVRSIDNGSNLFQLVVDSADPVRVRDVMRRRGIELPEPSTFFRGFVLTVNETLARRPLEDVVRAFEEAARA